jgi:hypothetical protein
MVLYYIISYIIFYYFSQSLAKIIIRARFLYFFNLGIGGEGILLKNAEIAGIFHSPLIPRFKNIQKTKSNYVFAEL